MCSVFGSQHFHDLRNGSLRDGGLDELTLGFGDGHRRDVPEAKRDEG